jgi:hypothetical protein
MLWIKVRQIGFVGSAAVGCVHPRPLFAATARRVLAQRP